MAEYKMTIDGQGTEMENALPVREKKPTAWKGLLFFVVLVFCFGGLGVFALSERSEAGPLVPQEAPEPIPVAVETVNLGSELTLNETFSGLVTARRSSTLGFSSTGRIARMSADVGDRVQKGAILARLDTRALQARLESAEASTAEAQALLELANTTVRRQRTLSAQGHVSDQLVDEAEAEADAATARIAAARAQADTLRVDIDLATIRAPYAGTITQRFVDEGAIAGPGATVFEIVETGHLEARIGLPAGAASVLVPGETYRLAADVGDMAATLRALTGVIDDRQRTVTSIFDIPNDQNATPGALVRLALEREISERGFWVPVSALTEANRGLWSVYVVESRAGGWVAAIRPVELVHSEGARAYVRGAVEDGERFITDGLQRLTPGQWVAPPASQAALSADRG